MRRILAVLFGALMATLPLATGVFADVQTLEPVNDITRYGVTEFDSETLQGYYWRGRGGAALTLRKGRYTMYFTTRFKNPDKFGDEIISYNGKYTIKMPMLVGYDWRCSYDNVCEPIYETQEKCFMNNWGQMECRDVEVQVGEDCEKVEDFCAFRKTGYAFYRTGSFDKFTIDKDKVILENNGEVFLEVDDVNSYMRVY